MSDILLAGTDWQARALLRAQLLEEGFDVEAVETIDEARAVLAAAPHFPQLMIADITASHDPTADVDSLTPWSGKLPIWVIASRTYVVDKGLRGHGFERIFLRPVEIGEVVEQVRRRLARPA